MFPKQGRVESVTYLAWLRRQGCAFCHADGPEAHHWPTKGSLGTRRDDWALPACLRCHARCHGRIVDGAAPIAGHEQLRVRASCWERFKDEAPLHEFEQVVREIVRWKTARGQ
jgi:hypothetical protein